MTGFARLIMHDRNVLSVPRDAISSLSAGKGVVRTVDADGKVKTTLVTFGNLDDQYVEITGGLAADDWVGFRITPGTCATTTKSTLPGLSLPRNKRGDGCIRTHQTPAGR